MMRYLASIALAAALAGGTATHASALLDQDFEGHNANGSFSSGVAGGFRTLQTFTVGITGTLSGVDIFYVGGGSPPLFTGLAIYSTAGGVPTGTLLQTASLTTATGGVASFGSNLAVTVGDVLAIEAVGALGTLNWAGSYSAFGGFPGDYAGGASFYTDHDGSSPLTTTLPTVSDHDFRTFVTTGGVPEPATWALLVGGFGLTGATLRRRRAQTAIAGA